MAPHQCIACMHDEDLAEVAVVGAAAGAHARHALARLGGPEAEGFLEFAARNEDEPDLRAAAERALRKVAESSIVEPSSRTARLSNRSPNRSPNRGHR